MVSFCMTRKQVFSATVVKSMTYPRTSERFIEKVTFEVNLGRRVRI